MVQGATAPPSVATSSHDVKSPIFWLVQGDRYDGEWREGKQHGRGQKRMANGDTYIGHWASGPANGWGRKSFSNGDAQEGCYKVGFLDSLHLCHSLLTYNDYFPSIRTTGEEGLVCTVGQMETATLAGGVMVACMAKA